MQDLSPNFIIRATEAFERFFGTLLSGEHLVFALIAIIPAAAWIYLFLRHQRENWFLVGLTFFFGMMSVIPVFIFQSEIEMVETWLGVIGGAGILTIILGSIWVGVYEETAKHWVVKHTDRGFIRSIDDAIQFSIIAALGFAFFENILYFYSIWNTQPGDSFAFYFLFRSLGSMFLHVFASGIFGYYYGVAHFAQPVLQDQLHHGKRFPLIGWLHRILHMKSETLFHEEKITEGLIIAAVLHGIFDFLMGYSQHLTNAGHAGIGKLLLVLAVPYLVGGFFWLTYLLDKKEDHKKYGHVTDERTSDV